MRLNTRWIGPCEKVDPWLLTRRLDMNTKLEISIKSKDGHTAIFEYTSRDHEVRILFNGGKAVFGACALAGVYEKIRKVSERSITNDYVNIAAPERLGGIMQPCEGPITCEDWEAGNATEKV